MIKIKLTIVPTKITKKGRVIRSHIKKVRFKQYGLSRIKQWNRYRY